ncbi:MAG: SH3 domain-containing protein [Candidatus Omnitrophica bacterium]|nr:SH3 domain-containing protein [Candidatus Omnitrophota bacterium]
MKLFYFRFIVSICLGLLSLPAFAQEELNYRAPTLLKDTSPEMLTPGYWISRYPSPDSVLLDTQEIQKFNADIQRKIKSVKDVAQLPESFSGDELTERLKSLLQEYQNKQYYMPSGEPVSEMFFQDVTSNLNLTSIPSVIEPQFGFILKYTAQRFLPTDDQLYERPGDVDFDYLQNNALQISEPVVILHKSFDGKWGYTLGSTSDGWVKLQDVVPCALKDIQEYQQNEKWAVVVEARADLFLDPQLNQFDQSVQMGTRFPKEKKQESAGAVAIKIPSIRSDGRFAFKTVYLDKREAQDGYLPYTARTIIKQAFKLLNRPYGWGGMYQEQDCSRFLQEIFASVGIDLPRDSKDQAKIGLPLAEFDLVMREKANLQKKEFFATTRNEVLILTLKGHIMMYLGNVDGKPYAIHSLWAYREPFEGNDRIRVINRVAVTSLELGEGSEKGSLNQRVTGVRTFTYGH